MDLKTVQRNSIVSFLSLLNFSTVADQLFALARLDEKDTQDLFFLLQKVEHRLRFDHVKRASREYQITDKFRESQRGR